MPSLSLPQLISYVIRFCISGGIATLAHWCVMALLIIGQQDAVVATAVGATVGAALNYLLQFHFTFAAQARHQTALPAYFIAVIASWSLNLALFGMLHQWLQWNALIAQLCTTGVVMLLNMIWYKRYVFHERIADR